jgi:hypothetical protein
MCNFGSHVKVEHILSVSENRVLRGTFDPKGEEVKGGLRKLHYEELKKLLVLLFLLLSSSLWLYNPLLGLGRVFSFLILHTVGRTPWTGDQPVARPLPVYRGTKTQNKCTQYRYPCLEWDSNPPSDCSSVRTLIHALDLAATVIGNS